MTNVQFGSGRLRIEQVRLRFTRRRVWLKGGRISEEAVCVFEIKAKTVERKKTCKDNGDRTKTASLDE